MILQGEKEAVETVLELAEIYGYGNMIAHLRRKWALKLIKDYGLNDKSALNATNKDSYPLDFDYLGLDM